MAHPVNEAKQRVLDARRALDRAQDEQARAKKDYGDLLMKQVEGRLTDADKARLNSFPEKVSAAEEQVSALRKALIGREEDLAGEEAKLQEMAEESRRRESGRNGQAVHQASELRGRIGAKYRELFGAVASSSAEGWENGSAEFFASVAKGLYHPSLIPAAKAFQNEGAGGDGGFLVPEEVSARAFDGALEDEPILRQVSIEPMVSETKRVAGFATKDHSTAGPFGFSGGWIGEGGTLSPEKALIKAVKLTAKKLGLLVQASNEVVADGLGFDAQLESAMRRALGWLLADAVFNGTGAGQPLGLLKAAARVVVLKEGAQAADTILYDNITKMLARLLPSSMTNAAWYASHTTRPQIMKLSVVVGAGGTWVPLVLGADGVYRLLGIPLYFTEHLPVLGDEGDLVLCDPTQYALGLRRGITMDRSAHVGFTNDLMTYRGIVRADGQPLHDAAFQPKNGDTQAPIVVLEAR